MHQNGKKVEAFGSTDLQTTTEQESFVVYHPEKLAKVTMLIQQHSCVSRQPSVRRPPSAVRRPPSFVVTCADEMYAIRSRSHPTRPRSRPDCV
jgi:hypothetical protein